MALKDISARGAKWVSFEPPNLKVHEKTQKTQKNAKIVKNRKKTGTKRQKNAIKPFPNVKIRNAAHGAKALWR